MRQNTKVIMGNILHCFFIGDENLTSTKISNQMQRVKMKQHQLKEKNHEFSIQKDGTAHQLERKSHQKDVFIKVPTI